MSEQPASGMQERILETAAALFVAHGYEGISIREIADACDLSKAGIYYHFKDKEGLFLAILDAHLVELNEILKKIELQSGSVRNKISSFIHGIFAELPPNHRAIIRLATHDMDKVNAAARADFDLRYRECFLDPLAGILGEGIAAGQVRPMELSSAVWALLGLVYPFLNQGSIQSEADAERISDFITAIYFDGVKI
ncbi:MAG: TetR/AcrR family transcriptional regulator [Anaerolineaceae bacterium]